MLPLNIDELLAADHPVRFVTAFVEGLKRAEWTELGFDLEVLAWVIQPPILDYYCRSGSMVL